MNLQNTKTAAVAIFIGTLLLGAVVGVVLDRTLLLESSSWQTYRQRPARDPGSARFFMRHFSKKLELTPQQQAALDSILAGNRLQFDDLRRRLHPRFSALRDSLDQQILVILTPEQREKFHALKRSGPRHLWERMREREKQ
jgi:Spy/CpxP family protein refolding chaperone